MIFGHRKLTAFAVGVGYLVWLTIRAPDLTDGALDALAWAGVGMLVALAGGNAMSKLAQRQSPAKLPPMPTGDRPPPPELE